MASAGIGFFWAVSVRLTGVFLRLLTGGTLSFFGGAGLGASQIFDSYKSIV